MQLEPLLPAAAYMYLRPGFSNTRVLPSIDSRSRGSAPPFCLLPPRPRRPRYRDYSSSSSSSLMALPFLRSCLLKMRWRDGRLATSSSSSQLKKIAPLHYPLFQPCLRMILSSILVRKGSKSTVGMQGKKTSKTWYRQPHNQNNP